MWDDGLPSAEGTARNSVGGGGDLHELRQGTWDPRFVSSSIGTGSSSSSNASFPAALSAVYVLGGYTDALRVGAKVTASTGTALLDVLRQQDKYEDDEEEVCGSVVYPYTSGTVWGNISWHQLLSPAQGTLIRCFPDRGEVCVVFHRPSLDMVRRVGHGGGGD